MDSWVIVDFSCVLLKWWLHVKSFRCVGCRHSEPCTQARCNSCAIFRHTREVKGKGRETCRESEQQNTTLGFCIYSFFRPTEWESKTKEHTDMYRGRDMWIHICLYLHTAEIFQWTRHRSLDESQAQLGYDTSTNTEYFIWHPSCEWKLCKMPLPLIMQQIHRNTHTHTHTHRHTHKCIHTDTHTHTQ